MSQAISTKAALETADPNEKTEAIVAAARKTFLAHGFDAASMDQIALAASVSKRTVYNRFRSKEELFGAAITKTCQNLLPVDMADIEASLPPDELVRALGRRVLTGLLEPEALSLRRIAAFEAERTPAIGKAYLEHGPGWMAQNCAPVLARLAAKGAYEIENIETAIWQLGALISEPLYAKALLGEMPDDLSAAIDAQVNRGVDAFKKIYGA